MSLEVLWRLPVDGDGRTFDQNEWTRGDYRSASRPAFARTGGRQEGYTPFDQLVQVARAAELGGFDGVLIPQSAAGEEPLVTAAALAREVRRLRLIPALPAQFLSAVYTAKIATSFQRLAAGRLALNLVTEEPGERPWHGRRREVAEQIARTDEFLDVLKGFWNEAPFTYHGQFYEVENGGFSGPLAGQPLPDIYLSGDTDEARALSGKHADVHILIADELPAIQAEIDRVSAFISGERPRLRFLVDIEVIARHTAEEAWAYLRSRWSPRDSEPDFDALRAGEHLWGGFDRFRTGPALGLVGSYAEVAEQLAAYAEAGVDGFVLGANPRLEEAYRIAEHVLPPLRARAGGAGRAAA